MIRQQLPAYSPVLPVQLVGACVDVLRSRDRPRDELEQHLTDRYSASRVLLTGSGTQALQLALMRCRKARGADVVVALPAYSCYDLITAAVGAEVRVMFYDIDPVSLTPERESFREALAAGASVAVAANLYGFPLDWEWLSAECRAAGATLIEDAAQGLGSGWGAAEAGSFGDLSILSFGRGKGWNGGGGGALIVHSAGELAGDGLSTMTEGGHGLRALLLSLALWGVGRPLLYRFPTLVPGLGLGETHYREPAPPAIMSSIGAATTLRHAEASLEAVAGRRTWAAAWRDRLQRSEPGLSPCEPVSGAHCGYLRFPVLASDRNHREVVLMATRTAGSAPGYPVSLPELPQAAGVAIEPRRPTPGATALAETLLTLPTHPRVSRRDLESIG